MFISNWIMVEDGIEVFEYFNFLRGEKGRVDEGERDEADVEEREDLDMIGRRDGGGQKYCCGCCRGAEVTLG